MPKRYKNLHESIYRFDTLYRAWERARRGKRYRPDVLQFTSRLGMNIMTLQREIWNLTWFPGLYKSKIVREPKRRVIHIAPFRDRVVHQAVCEVIAPLFEETFIYDSYACRKGKGSHLAVNRLMAFLRKKNGRYVLKGDFKKYFDSIPHGLVMRELEWRIADRAVLTLLKRVLSSYESGFVGNSGFNPRGIPIGNLTSQWFANIVGNRLDQFVKHDLKCRRYIRYMDDWIMVLNSKTQLREYLAQIKKFIGEIGLVLNPKTRIYAAREGVPFLGYRVWRDHRRVLRSNVVAGRRRLRRQIAALEREEVDSATVIDSLRSWFAHLSHADSYHLRRQIWREVGPILDRYVRR